MGIADRDAVPGLLVRHQSGWTGRLERLGMPGIAEVTPDGGSGPRWFHLADFEPADWDGGQLPVRLPMPYGLAAIDQAAGWQDVAVPRATTLERRYLTDPGFHALVTYLGQLLQDASYADLQDAAVLAIRIDGDRKRAAGDDVRERKQTDAQEGRGNDGPAEQEPCRPGSGAVSR